MKFREPKAPKAVFDIGNQIQEDPWIGVIKF